MYAVYKDPLCFYKYTSLLAQNSDICRSDRETKKEENIWAR